MLLGIFLRLRSEIVKKNFNMLENCWHNYTYLGIFVNKPFNRDQVIPFKKAGFCLQTELAP